MQKWRPSKAGPSAVEEVAAVEAAMVVGATVRAAVVVVALGEEEKAVAGRVAVVLVVAWWVVEAVAKGVAAWVAVAKAAVSMRCHRFACSTCASTQRSMGSRSWWDM